MIDKDIRESFLDIDKSAKCPRKLISSVRDAKFNRKGTTNIWELIGDGPKSFTKLYSSREDGSDVVEFHSRCDNRGRTLTLVYNSAGEVYGGYTSVSWQSYSNKPVYDNKAFIFVLANQEGTAPIKFNIKKPESALVLDGGCGPIFGTGPDIKVCMEKGDGRNARLTIQQNPASYDHETGSLGSYLSRDELASEVVVYRVEDVTMKLMDRQWRTEPRFDREHLQNLKEEVELYWPLRDMGVSEDALRNVNILFVGPVGAGKSSFLNSVESSFRGHVTLTAGAGSRDKSVTSAFRRYPITASDNRRCLRFQLCDCRGLQDGIDITKDIDSILEGHMPNNYVINTSSAMKANMHGYKQHPRLEDKIHCVVYVIDADKHSNHADIHTPFITDNVKKQMKTIQENVDQKGIPQLILLNKVDTACDSTNKSTSEVFRSSAIRQRCIDAADCLGLPPMTVMPMKNYFMEPSTTDDISILALFNIRQMLRAADSFLRINHLDELRADRYEKLVHYLQSLKEEVEEYYPLRDTGVSEDALRHVNILFVGQVGAGKSSFVNSVESAFRCYVTMTASAGSRSKSLTSMFRKYTIISSKTRRPLRFQLCDYRGLQDGIDITQDIDHILEGHMRNNYVVSSVCDT
ncbi:interferon-induced protein 44-like [Pecten maximus]|uniref:interferon-induced protein 44-like n=1 Tax=Pecten maximus TaxID=6579 RepID=UPI0014581F62|nr:interferon-induced protein 44-like [Pecten maximus]